MYFLDGEFDEVAFVSLSESELTVSRHHVEITRHLQEIHHLFLMLKYDIESLQKEYTLDVSGKVFRGGKPAKREEDFIAVNAHVINIISAGRTLTEAMECYINTNERIEPEAKNRYKSFCSNTYDKSFSYRLLIRLRDFSQHGHLPVCKTHNNYCFDLKQILEKPHFNHNEKLRRQMADIADEIMTVYRDTPTFSLTRTIAEYTDRLFSVYREFLVQTETELKKSYFDFRNVIQENPDNVIADGGMFDGCFIYDIQDGMAHAVHTADDASAMFDKFKAEAEGLSAEYSQAYERLIDGTVWIRCIDNERIEIGTERI